MLRAGFVLVLLLLLDSGTAKAALTKEELLKLVQSGVATDLIVGLVQKDCVGFEVDASAVLELSGSLPKEVLGAAIECRSKIEALAQKAAPPGVTATATGLALSASPPLTLQQVKTVAVIPMVLDGNADAAMTSHFVEQLKRLRPKIKVVDAVTLQVHFEDTGAFHSNAPLKSILAAARAVGVDAVFLGTGDLYQGGLLGLDPAARLDVKLLEVNRGALLWSQGTQATGHSWQNARSDVAKKVLKKVPL